MQAGEFVREEIDDPRKGKSGAIRKVRNCLLKALRAGVNLPPPEKGEGAYELGHGAAPKGPALLEERTVEWNACKWIA